MKKLGYYLRSSREELGISIEELSEITQIEIEYLLAMEDGNFDALPGPVYIRSYLRTYCINVNLDPKKVIRVYQQKKQQTNEPLSRTARVKKQMQQSGRNTTVSKKRESQDTTRITRSQKVVQAKASVSGFAKFYNRMLMAGFALLLIGTGVLFYLRWSTDEVAKVSDKVVLLTASESSVMLG